MPAVTHTAEHRAPARAAAALCAVLFLPLLSLSRGNTTYDFLRSDVSARSAALAGGFVSQTDDPNLLFTNPAGLASLSRRRISFGFFKHLLDINAGYASGAAEIAGYGVVAGGVQYINYGEFKRTGEEGQDLGTFGAGELAAQAAYAGTLESGLRYGAAVKFIYSSIAGIRSTAAAVDLGIQSVVVPDRMTVGLSLLNLGAQLDPYYTTRENLPLDFRAGFSVVPEHLPAVLSVGFSKLNESVDKFTDRLKTFTVGVEFSAAPGVQLRAGYNNERRRELKIGSSAGLAGLSFGAGAAADIYAFDYSFSSLGPIGALHRISIGVAF